MKAPLHTYITLDENAQFYECGFSCDNALILRIEDERYFFTDSRYVLEAKEYVFPHTQVIQSTDFIKNAQDILKKKRIKHLIFNPQELSLAFYEQFASKCEAISCKLEPKANFHQLLRIKKTPQEIAKITKSQKLNKKAFKHFAYYIQKILEKTPSEKQLHYQAIQLLSHFGDYNLSFEPIVGINANGAKPHALPNAKCFLKKNDVLLFDAGIKYQRYCSDMTRTASIRGNIRFSKKQKFKDKFVQKIYDIVHKAQEETIKKTRSGMRGKEIDAIARGVIDKSGYAQYFIHSTGHGVGLDIHELPRISRSSEDIIEDGMVFSIEPGIYLPQQFGIRIEDLVVMQNGRAQVI